MAVSAPVLVYLFGADALPESADWKSRMDERVRFRMPGTERFVSAVKLRFHLLTVALWEARDTGVFGVHVEKRPRRFFGTKTVVHLLPGTLPTDPNPWQRSIWESVTSTTSRPSLKGFACVLDLHDRNSLTSAGGTTLRWVQWEAADAGLLSDSPTREEYGFALADPAIDAEAIAAIAEDGRRVVDRYRSFCESEPDLRDLFFEATRDGTLRS